MLKYKCLIFLYMSSAVAMQDQEIPIRLKSWLEYVSPQLRKYCYESPKNPKCQRIRERLLNFAQGHESLLGSLKDYCKYDSYCKDVKDALKETVLPSLEQEMETQISHRNRHAIQEAYDEFENRRANCSRFNFLCILQHDVQHERWIKAMKEFPTQITQAPTLYFKEKDKVDTPDQLYHTVSAFENEKLGGKMTMEVFLDRKSDGVSKCSLVYFFLERAAQNSKMPRELLAQQATFAKKLRCKKISMRLTSDHSFQEELLDIFRGVGADERDGFASYGKESIGHYRWWKFRCALPDNIKETGEAMQREYFKCKKKSTEKGAGREYL